jgi:hypothetical protein
LHDADGRRAIPFVFTDLPKGASSPEWSPGRQDDRLRPAPSNPTDLAKHEKKSATNEEQKKSAGRSGFAATRRG